MKEFFLVFSTTYKQTQEFLGEFFFSLTSPLSNKRPLLVNKGALLSNKRPLHSLYSRFTFASPILRSKPRSWVIAA